MILYKNNLKTGKYRLSPEDIADEFLNTRSQALENIKYGWPVRRGLYLFIASELKSSVDIQEGNNEEDFEKARQIIASKIEYYE